MLRTVQGQCIGTLACSANILVNIYVIEDFLNTTKASNKEGNITIIYKRLEKIRSSRLIYRLNLDILTKKTKNNKMQL